MVKLFRLLVIIFLFCTQATAGSFDAIRRALEQSSLSQVQEKVYVHTDNECYFVGDTLWYKAYVVRADNLRPTDMSRLLYVELLSPDGLLVERQTVVVSPDGGYSCGQFALQDSLYSGYYELRAYTRWMLNFNVSHHRYSEHDTWHFYNKKMAADYFRMWDGLYSRVLPVYSKPEAAGDYDVRRMYQRPKTILPRKKKDDLVVTFYPEGGHLIQGVENRVAFDIVDQHGEAVDIKGVVRGRDMADIPIVTDYMGRGSFLVTPSEARLKAYFTFRGKDYDISLPKAESAGMALQLDEDQLRLTTKNLPADKYYGLSILCRGSLQYFDSLKITNHGTIRMPLEALPTGVNDVTVFDEEGKIMADRLFFVNHQQEDSLTAELPDLKTRTFGPYEKVEMPVRLTGAQFPMHFSISVHDTNTNEPTYNDGNIMTDLLLSSELRGFIARPAYYFERSDETHRRRLDLLMMVQGWRKYKWQELADTAREMRYEPEKTMTIEGAVYKMLSVNPVEPDEISNWQDGVGYYSRQLDAEKYEDPFATADVTIVDNASDLNGNTETPTPESESMETDAGTDMYLGAISGANDDLGVNHGNLKHEVLIEAEIIVNNQMAGGIQKTENGRFLFQVPPFYGEGYLNMKAYQEKDSLRKNMESRKDREVMDEDAFPDYYVKRDLFFPIYTREYDYYERHQPDYDAEMLIDTLSDLSMENEVHQLENTTVKGRRRGRRAIDWNRPAYVLNAYDLYNEITDRGLSFGKIDMRQFPEQVCRYLFGNMNRYNSFNVDGRIDGAVYYRNYSPLSKYASEVEQASLYRANRTSQLLYSKLKLKRLQDVRVFTDYEPRLEDSTMVEEMYRADATVELVNIPDEGRQVTFRDRHIILQGINYPEQFYQPDYSSSQPAEPTDYRRTLYWNPNAVTDEQGRFTATFYNNSKETRVKVTVAGISSDGQFLYK